MEMKVAYPNKGVYRHEHLTYTNLAYEPSDLSGHRNYSFPVSRFDVPANANGPKTLKRTCKIILLRSRLTCYLKSHEHAHNVHVPTYTQQLCSLLDMN